MATNNNNNAAASAAAVVNERVQTIVFVRHGIAKHNLIDPNTGHQPNLKDPTLWDPPLVRDGRLQAVDAGEKLSIWWDTTQLGEKVELVLISPLTRCLQTATLAFLPGSYYTNGLSEPRFVCDEQVREAYGKHYPDKRNLKSVLEKHWPTVEFHPTMTENDNAWSPTQRESIDDLSVRVANFLQTLVQRSETNIVVVSHGVWIEVCLNLYCPSSLGHGSRRVYNCDMFAGECVSSIQGKFVRLQNFRQIQ